MTSSISGTGTNDRPKDDPVLNLENKTVTFDEGETTNVTVKVTGTAGARPSRGGTHVLTSGGKFTDATVTLVDKPTWVKDISVVNGDIVIDVKSRGTYIYVK